MKRREFLTGVAATAGLTGGAMALPTAVRAGIADNPATEYYELRKYHLRMGAKPKLAEDFWRDVGLPALKRLGIGPVGVFNVVIGAESPTLYLLMTHPSAESVMTLSARLADDAEYQKAGRSFLEAPSTDPSYERKESSVLAALSGMPRLKVPDGAATNKPRLFELRTYKSHSEKACATKVEMFNKGEIPLFQQSGFHSVFFGKAVIGADVPSITYMLSFEDLAARDKYFAAFGSNPEFRKMAALPQYANLLTTITNTILRPTAFSQI